MIGQARPEGMSGAPAREMDRLQKPGGGGRPNGGTGAGSAGDGFRFSTSIRPGTVRSWPGDHVLLLCGAVKQLIGKCVKTLKVCTP